MLKSRIHRLSDRLGLYLRHAQLNRARAQRRPSKYLNERSLEYAFALENLSSHKALDVLDVGTGGNSFAATLQHCGYNVTASDLMGDYWSTYENPHIIVHRDDITHSSFDSESFDAVNCISTLEHIDDYDSAVSNMVRVLTVGGILILTCPYSHDQFCGNVYELDTADAMSKRFRYIARSFSNVEIDRWCSNFGLDIVARRYIRGWEGKFWRSGDRIIYPYETESIEEANCVCLAMQKTR